MFQEIGGYGLVHTSSQEVSRQYRIWTRQTETALNSDAPTPRLCRVTISAVVRRRYILRKRVCLAPLRICLTASYSRELILCFALETRNSLR